MLWKNFFEAGGWGMFPTSICGFLLLAAALLLALRPERRFLPAVISLGLMTLGSGALSSCVGIVNTFHYLATVPAARHHEITIMGTAESLHCVVLALLLIQVALVLTSIAAVRASRTRATV